MFALLLVGSGSAALLFIGLGWLIARLQIPRRGRHRGP